MRPQQPPRRKRRSLAHCPCPVRPDSYLPVRLVRAGRWNDTDAPSRAIPRSMLQRSCRPRQPPTSPVRSKSTCLCNSPRLSPGIRKGTRARCQSPRCRPARTGVGRTAVPRAHRRADCFLRGPGRAADGRTGPQACKARGTGTRGGRGAAEGQRSEPRGPPASSRGGKHHKDLTRKRPKPSSGSVAETGCGRREARHGP